MSTHFKRTLANRLALGVMALSVGGTLIVPSVALAETSTAGFSGKVSSIIDADSFWAEVRVVYAGGGSAGIGGILPPGKIVTVNIVPGTLITNARGQAMTFAEVTAGVLFNATVQVDTVTKAITASKIQFGTRLAAPPSPPPSPTPTPTPGPTPTPTPPPGSTTTGTVGFSGKVSSIIDADSFWAEVRVVYAGEKTNRKGAGLVLPPGTVLTVNIPAGTLIKNTQGQVITLAQVAPGDYFNATAQVDTVTKTATARSITFSGKTPVPPPTPTPPPPGTPPPPPETPPPGTTAQINFAGRVQSVDAATRIAIVTTRFVYGGTSGGPRLMLALPAGTQITLTVPAGTPIHRLGVPITLADVQAGDLFNARASIDRVAKTGVAKNIQVLTPSIAANACAGTITSVSTLDPQSVTIKNQQAQEQKFTIVATTKIFIGNRSTPGTISQLAVGQYAVTSYVTISGTKQAVQIVMANPAEQEKIIKWSTKFFAIDAVNRRCTRATNLISATLTRMEKIIAKQEVAIGDLKSQGKDTTKAEADLAQSKTDFATARASLVASKEKCALITTSTDTHQAVVDAHISIRASVEATKVVHKDTKNTQRDIKAL